MTEATNMENTENRRLESLAQTVQQRIVSIFNSHKLWPIIYIPYGIYSNKAYGPY